jgi:hypothetical protein
MKKMLYAALAAVFLLAALSTVAFAAQNVTNPAQKGSLLVWPKIVVDRTYTGAGDTNSNGQTGLVTADTVVTIANDYSVLVDVKCYWMDEYQNIQDFAFRITKNQIVWFRASDGMGMGGSDAVFVPPFDGNRGELKCWAVNVAGTRQISWNHLFGTATIYDYVAGDAWEYSTWNFAARNVARNKPVGTGGELKLTGADGGYDACPEYVLGTFLANRTDDDFGKQDGIEARGSDLTLVPCKQDLRQDRIPTYTKAQFDIWNEDEVKSTGAYMCFKCWLETALQPMPSSSAGAGTYRNFDKFGIGSLHTDLGFFRVTGVASTACKAVDWSQFPGPYTTVPTPLIGLRSHSLYFPPGDNAIVGSTLNTAGFDGSGFVKWDPQWAHPEMDGR